MNGNSENFSLLKSLDGYKMNLKNRETEIKLFLWQNPHDQKWHVVDIAGYSYGESLNPQKAKNSRE